MVSTDVSSMRRQQYLVMPSESRTLPASSPCAVRSLYSACLSATTLPHVKHLTGISTPATRLGAYKNPRGAQFCGVDRRRLAGAPLACLPCCAVRNRRAGVWRGGQAEEGGGEETRCGAAGASPSSLPRWCARRRRHGLSARAMRVAGRGPGHIYGPLILVLNARLGLQRRRCRALPARTPAARLPAGLCAARLPWIIKSASACPARVSPSLAKGASLRG